MMKRHLLVVFFVLFCGGLIFGQCDLAYDVIDDFDSTRVVTAAAVNIGYMIPSKYEIETGPKMVEEAKILFGFTREEEASTFFITLVTMERKVFKIGTGHNVLFKIVTEGYEDVVGLYNNPTRGEFDPATNMRKYHHTCLVPLDAFYRFANGSIEKIRINYDDFKKTIKLTPEQQEAIKEAVRCVGKAAEMYPVRP
jgi:hypothetical protein